MRRVERAAHAILERHGVHMDALRVPGGFEDPANWTVALVAEVEGRVVGVAWLSEVDADVLALDQVSVEPEHAGRGIGRQLLLAAVSTARELGYTALTGTTFRDIAFNAPFYATLGCVEDADPHPVMRHRRGVEREVGLDRFGTRIVMRLLL